MSDCFPVEHQPTDFYNKDGVFTARYGLEFLCNSR